jgi:myosin-5
MSYLASVDSRTGGGARAGVLEVTARVLQTNPLLEAFGNASTTRNDNSSRFGKFIKLQYDQRGKQIGAHLDTYLLERSRVVRQSAAERNFHVFHAVTGGVAADERAELAVQPATAYHFLGRRPAAAMALKKSSDFCNDAEVWGRTQRALLNLGFSPADIEAVSNALVAVLALGELDFAAAETSEGQVSSPTQPVAVAAAALRLGVQDADLSSKICTRYVAAPDGWFTVHLTVQQCCNARDALAKALYGRLFDWLVARANETIKPDDAALAGRAADADDSTGFIGILDIFGFESFAVNSFEQLCINYANEALQAQFNAYVFAQQQAEYEVEGVPWQRVEFADNASVLAMIEDSRQGLLMLLDEECMLGQGTVSGFFTKLKSAQSGCANFSVPRIARDTLQVRDARDRRPPAGGGRDDC